MERQNQISRRTDEVELSGFARNVTWSLTPGRKREQILAFEIEQVDDKGATIGTLVELKARSIVGNLNDGDQVKLKGQIGEDGVLRPTAFSNITKESLVTTETTYRGIARDVKEVTLEQRFMTPLQFRLEQTSGAGDILGYLQVNVRGTFMSAGAVADGDELRVTGRIGRDGVLWADRIYNLTTDVPVRGWFGLRFVIAAQGLFLLFSIIVFTVFGVFVASSACPGDAENGIHKNGDGIWETVHPEN